MTLKLISEPCGSRVNMDQNSQNGSRVMDQNSQNVLIQSSRAAWPT